MLLSEVINLIPFDARKTLAILLSSFRLVVLKSADGRSLRLFDNGYRWTMHIGIFAQSDAGLFLFALKKADILPSGLLIPGPSRTFVRTKAFSISYHLGERHG